MRKARWLVARERTTRSIDLGWERMIHCLQRGKGPWDRVDSEARVTLTWRNTRIFFGDAEGALNIARKQAGTAEFLSI